ncbi:MAG: bifunctional riboflavin kinase/FAD synthetase [Gomphosphaeria aponina SAG 52.96 = DSM 107014]|uniref:Riboflavin biosynthesis protein n=1 Tax=Gomphosphaeria aponina SAG 52.96 = DSM 107014 TaxID=1521640 RepID=A0A941JSL0_9CHRO|nr:bifunctional riboflavin kinase/FAD synthetase [Gomphosphaeria aponina SAG 52.96 = DSM 107014]
MRVTSSTKEILKPNAIALGNFDGIHRGHQQVVQPILKIAKETSLYSTIVTFNPHPREYFSREKKKLLTPLKEKIKLLEDLGVEQLVLLPFNRELAELSPQEFVEQILVKQLEAKWISVGEDFRFGHKRAGKSQDLEAIAAQFGIKVYIIIEQKCQGEKEQIRISSSNIRHALEAGKLETVQTMLGRSYTLTGEVVTGAKLGRKIGFPTANLNLPPEKFLPRYGVYSVKVFLAGETTPILGVMNIGCRPTVEGKHPTVEVHLLDWTGDLYGKTITVSLVKFLRAEQKFPSLPALKEQITADCDAARKKLLMDQG